MFHFDSGFSWLLDLGLKLVIWGIPVLFAVTFHELAHGVVADYLGDPTPRMMGRLSANPLVHVDPFGTILLPLILLLSHTGLMFGYAKPIPINTRNLHHYRRDSVLVAFAGPGSNLMMALISMSLLHAFLTTLPLTVTSPMWGEVLPVFLAMMKASITVNIVLFFFNMIPLPPLDGGRVATGLLPDFIAAPLSRVEPYGIWIIFGLVILDPYLGILSRTLWPLVETTTSSIITLAYDPSALFHLGGASPE
ncbi:MAG: site-2 protease family protein [Leptospirillum sp.]